MTTPGLPAPRMRSSEPSRSAQPFALAGRGAVARAIRALESDRREIIAAWYRTQFAPDLLRRYGVAGAEDQPRESLERSFLEPLLLLLIACLRTGAGRFRDVYRDERLRYAPHQATPAVRTAYFREILPADEEVLLRPLEGNPEAAATLRSFLDELHAPLMETQGGDRIHLLAVGDCLLNELRVFLPGRCRPAGIDLDIRCLYFSALVGRGLTTEQVLGYLERQAPDLIAFSFLSYEGLPPYPALLRQADHLDAEELDTRVTALTATIRQFLADLRERTDVPFLVHNASGLPLTRLRNHLLLLTPLSGGRRRVVAALNRALAEIVAHTPNTLLIDEAAVARGRGLRRCARPVVPSSTAREAFFHTSRFGEFLAEPYAEVLRSYRDLRKAKVLLVDFDNTLWDGVMADGPVRHDLQAQRLLRELKDAGMLLVALSKNDPGNIRWDEMMLVPSDFVLQKISWNLKAQSIEEAAQALDLGLDSFVLIDDNPAERELVRSQLPAVRVLDAGDPFTWQSLERLLAFPNTRATEEAKARTDMYRAQALRHEARSHEYDYPALMASLELEARFGPATSRDLDRVGELVQRTNQFNTTTIRHTRQQLQQFLASPDHGVYVTELSDKFGKLGLVAVVIVRREAAAVIFDSFVMSCRAMGFGLECLMLRLTMDAEGDGRQYVGRFIPTDRNTPAAGLFPENGFVATDTGNFTLDAAAPRPPLPEWIRTVRRD